MHSQTNGTKHCVFRKASRPPSLEQSERRGLFFVRLHPCPWCLGSWGADDGGGGLLTAWNSYAFHSIVLLEIILSVYSIFNIIAMWELMLGSQINITKNSMDLTFRSLVPAYYGYCRPLRWLVFCRYRCQYLMWYFCDWPKGQNFVPANIVPNHSLVSSPQGEKGAGHETSPTIIQNIRIYRPCTTSILI